MRTCRTSTRVLPDNGIDYHFVACGKPATQSVLVGLMLSHYCDEHAAAARRFVEKQGQASIIGTQFLVPNALKPSGDKP